MENENLFNGCYRCPAPETCPYACKCKENPHPKAPFSRSLICFLNFSTEIVKDVYERQTQLPKYTIGETLNQWLWLNRGTVENLSAAAFDFGEEERDFTELDFAYNFLKNTVETAKANFLKKPLALLSVCVKRHDEKVLSKNIFASNGTETQATD